MGEIVFDLAPHRTKGFAEGSVQTALGKRNRIAVGQPFCAWERPGDRSGLLVEDDLRAFPADHHGFVRLTFHATLLPDAGCRFVMADLVLVLQQATPQDRLPLFARLDPASSATLATGRPDFPARLSSFGAGTSEAGWRFAVTEDGEIPLTITDLKALVVLPREDVARVSFRLAAKIEVQATVDRWLSVLFTRGLPATADCEISPATAGAARGEGGPPTAAGEPAAPRPWPAKLSGSDLEELVASLVDAFPDPSTLAQMLRFRLDWSLNEIAAPGNLRAVVFDLVRHAEARGAIPALFDAARAEAPGNPKILALAAKRRA